MIERSLSSLESIVAGLRRDVDRLEKRPLCKGGKTPQTPPPPVTGSFGYVYLYQKATGKVFRATQDRIHPEVVIQLPKGVADVQDDDMRWEATDAVAQNGVWTARKGYDEFIVDFNAGTVSPNLPTPNGSFHHQVSYTATSRGVKYAVIGEYRNGSTGVANIYDTATGQRLAELRENKKFDVDPQDTTPIVTRALPGPTPGFEIWDTTGGSFTKLRDVPIQEAAGVGLSAKGCVYTGLFYYPDYSNGAICRFFNWETGKEISFKNKKIPSIAYNGWMGYHDGVRTHPDGAAITRSTVWGSPPPAALSPAYIPYGAGIQDIKGNDVLSLNRIPGFSHSEYGVIYDADPLPPLNDGWDDIDFVG